eukprot:CAMPEP_0172385982 /NCGR_PEP_ID=MMETSP1061-20121228/3584_1 /TAXON_ID=37318 /ORGANISM="Pseudo-nitzschia pungens, Strain cf. pungens" /LENGTH=304 /DNA_ID=CAMNT_0013115199 /DNA_START=243 /DNA_END=1154 /DNA_ORIENTATION=-
MSLYGGTYTTIVNKSTPRTITIIVMVMGPKMTFPSWLSLLEQITGELQFVYASYDEEISPHEKRSSVSLNYETIFIPDTTWTEGRTLLGEKAIELEVHRKRQFDYWLYLDDDIVLVDKHNNDASPTQTLQQFFDVLGADDIPSRVTTISPTSNHRKEVDALVGVSNVDAMVNAFKREYVPYLQPYAVLPVGGSQWVSQLAVFCIMRECMPLSVLALPNLVGTNKLHRDYPRGMDMDQLEEAVKNNYGGYFDQCRRNFSADVRLYEQQQPKTQSVDSFHELQAVIPEPELSKPSCRFLKDRYEKW